ncbi:MAG: hypothetical protein KA349_05535, partial [Burkholderiaceae bacterium]|nr:hypothetical protein [Burkholderiaceae bacterium]
DQLHPQEPAWLARLGAPLVQGQAAVGVRLGVDGEALPFGSELVRVLATPGHTGFCLSYAWRDRLFCGGLLAVEACPHQPRPAAAPALWDSVTARVFTLPDETLLFAGQMDGGRCVSTVLEQRRWHRHFADRSRDEFLARMAGLPVAPRALAEPPASGVPESAAEAPTPGRTPAAPVALPS